MTLTEQAKPLPLKEFWKRPCPERVILLGKGPSVDRYVPENGTVVVALNEAAAAFRCDYMFYVDYNVGDVEIPDSVIPVRSVKTIEKHGGRGYSYVARDEIPDGMRGCASGSAVWILGKWGVKEILFVGFDGWDDPRPAVQYGKRITAINPLPSPNYSKINSTIRAALEATGVRAVWFHRQLREDDNG